MKPLTALTILSQNNNQRGRNYDRSREKSKIYTNESRGAEL